MKIIFSEECLRYRQKGHPESPERIESSYNLLRKKNYGFLKPELADEKDILRVHTKEHLERVKSGDFVNMDSPAYKNIFHYAKLSVGGAIMAMQEKGFSLMRPPGHHAGKNFLGGFCYFNNLAIAVAKALEEIQKIAIIDFDVHHGNGTQDIFLGNKKVVYVSLHRSPLYPGTGTLSEKNCYNYPLPPETPKKLYFEKLKKALNQVKKFNPEMIAVSAGFDTHIDDPIGDFRLVSWDYEDIGRMIASLEKPVFSVLEGGYSKKLGDCIFAYLRGVSSD